MSVASLRSSLLFTGVRINSWAKVENAVVMPYVHIGRSAEVYNAVIDRGVQIPEGLVIGKDPELDGRRFRRTDKGIVLVTQKMIDQINT